MQITLSERAFSERIRELEGLGPDVSVEEIDHRLKHYAANLFKHLAKYGLSGIGLLSMAGKLGTFQVTLERCWDDESRNQRIEGLAMLDPLSLTVERSDLGAFYVGMLLNTMYDAWNTYAPELQRLTVRELDEALQRIAEKIAFAPQQTAEDTPPEIAAIQREQDFQMFLARSGKRDPLARHTAADEYRRAEEAAVSAAYEARYQRFRNGEI